MWSPDSLKFQFNGIIAVSLRNIPLFGIETYGPAEHNITKDRKQKIYWQIAMGNSELCVCVTCH